MTKRERQRKIAEIRQYLRTATIFFLVGIVLVAVANLTWGDSFLGEWRHLPCPWFLAGLIGGTLTGGWYVGWMYFSKKAEERTERVRLSDAYSCYIGLLAGGPLLFYPAIIRKTLQLRKLEKEEDDSAWEL